ncbi:MAG: type II toxin-antitoxin system RelE family toxin [Vicinamibacteria bacterium]
MQARYHPTLVEQLAAAPPPVRDAFNRKVQLLVRDLRHPSLHAKKYDEERDIWQARVTQDWRLYFQIEGDTYTILSLVSHPK